MTDRAALYEVRVRRRSGGGEPLPLGDVDGAGTSLVDVLADVLAGFAWTSEDGARAVRSLTVGRDGDDLFAVLQYGRRGVAAEIADADGAVRLRQTPDDFQLVRHGCLFRLPVSAAAGVLAAHVSNGRGFKSAFEQGLGSRLRARLPGLVVALDRLGDGDLLRSAVADGRIGRLRLVRDDPPGTPAGGATGWLDAGTPARVELEVAPSTPGGRLRTALLERYLGGDESAFAEIVGFGALRFDAALVEVVIDDRTRRLVDIVHPATSRPLTRALVGIRVDADGEPTDESLLGALRAVLP